MAINSGNYAMLYKQLVLSTSGQLRSTEILLVGDNKMANSRYNGCIELKNAHLLSLVN